MSIRSLGWERYVANSNADANAFTGKTIGRVTAENKTNWIVGTDEGEHTAVILRNFTRANPVPKTGDWVAYDPIENDKGKILITAVLPRFSTLSRITPKANPNPDAPDISQIIAVNVDTAFIIQGLDNNFNEKRIERYLVMVRQGNAKPAIILNKTDLAQNIDATKQAMSERFPDVPVFFISATTGQGTETLAHAIEPEETVTFLGSSGVGKSTLLNALLGADIQSTGAVREQDSRGRHTTTRRELFVLPSGGIVIDTPGMRELQISADTEQVEGVFNTINALAQQCRFPDCDHERSQGCAIRNAVARGDISEETYKSFIKLRREAEFNESKDSVQYQQAKKQFWKTVHKSLKLRNEFEHKDK